MKELTTKNAAGGLEQFEETLQKISFFFYRRIDREFYGKVFYGVMNLRKETQRKCFNTRQRIADKKIDME